MLSKKGKEESKWKMGKVGTKDLSKLGNYGVIMSVPGRKAGRAKSNFAGGTILNPVNFFIGKSASWELQPHQWCWISKIHPVILLESQSVKSGVLYKIKGK